MADDKTKVNMSFETDLSQLEIAFVAGCLGALRFVKDKFKKPEVSKDSEVKHKKKKLNSEV